MAVSVRLQRSQPYASIWPPPPRQGCATPGLRPPLTRLLGKRRIALKQQVHLKNPLRHLVAGFDRHSHCGKARRRRLLGQAPAIRINATNRTTLLIQPLARDHRIIYRAFGTFLPPQFHVVLKRHEPAVGERRVCCLASYFTSNFPRSFVRRRRADLGVLHRVTQCGTVV